jgi:hypothetical protein
VERLLQLYPTTVLEHLFHMLLNNPEVGLAAASGGGDRSAVAQYVGKAEERVSGLRGMSGTLRRRLLLSG